MRWGAGSLAAIGREVTSDACQVSRAAETVRVPPTPATCHSERSEESSWVFVIRQGQRRSQWILHFVQNDKSRSGGDALHARGDPPVLARGRAQDGGREI